MKNQTEDFLLIVIMPRRGSGIGVQVLTLPEFETLAGLEDILGLCVRGLGEDLYKI